MSKDDRQKQTGTFPTRHTASEATVRVQLDSIILPERLKLASENYQNSRDARSICDINHLCISRRVPCAAGLYSPMGNTIFEAAPRDG